MIIQCQRPKKSKQNPKKGQIETTRKPAIIRVLKRDRVMPETGEITAIEPSQSQFDVIPLRDMVQSYASETRTKQEALALLGG